MEFEKSIELRANVAVKFAPQMSIDDAICLLGNHSSQCELYAGDPRQIDQGQLSIRAKQYREMQYALMDTVFVSAIREGRKAR